jgi:hypothetical protein
MVALFFIFIPAISSPTAARVHSEHYSHWEQATPVLEAVCGSIPVVAAAAVVPIPVVGIAGAEVAAVVGVMAPEQAGPTPAAAAQLAGHPSFAVAVTAEVAAEPADPTHSAAEVGE